MPRSYTQRLSIPVEPAFKERLNQAIPDMVRATFIRTLVSVGLECVERDPNLLSLILHGSQFIAIAPSGQNLTISGDKDEE